MVSIKLGLNQFIIPQRCNFPPATPQVSRISFPHGMCGSQTHLLFWGWGVRYLHLPHVGDECFLCACAAPTIHMRVRKHPNLHVHRLGGGEGATSGTLCCLSSCWRLSAWWGRCTQVEVARSVISGFGRIQARLCPLLSYFLLCLYYYTYLLFLYTFKRWLQNLLVVS